MFQVDPNLWLQSFATPWLTWLMKTISFFGYDWFYPALVIVLAFGVRYRPALGVMLALLIAGLCTHAIKESAGMPRPSDVDVRVLDKGKVHTPLVEHGGAASFWSLPSSTAITAARRQPEPDYGFISGHVCAATTLVLSLILCFRLRRRWVLGLLLCWPPAMMLSRMYLGRHFLGDALGGLFVGTLMALLAAALLPRLLPTSRNHDRIRVAILAGLGLLAGGLSLAGFAIEADHAGQLLGLVLVFALITIAPLGKSDHGTWAQRIARIAIAFALYAGMEWLLIPTGIVSELAYSTLGFVIVIAGARWLSSEIGLYGPPRISPDAEEQAWSPAQSGHGAAATKPVD